MSKFNSKGTSGVPTEQIEWLCDFKAKRGRPLRVLHVGNIANNAFLNAKFLRRVGVEADVLSYNYQHVMALPEWEEVEIRSGHGHDDNPSFSPEDLLGYHRPKWFFQGPLTACVREIETHYESGRHWSYRPAGRLFDLSIRWVEDRINARLAYLISLLISSPRLAAIKVHQFLARRLAERTHWRPRILVRIAPYFQKPVRKVVALLIDCLPTPNIARAELEKAISNTLAMFQDFFPDRADQLSRDEVVPYFLQGQTLRAAFRHYDIVQCYATEPMHALLNDTRPYVAFEHGTLRDFTMGDNTIHRLTALGYRAADHCFITNGDCLDFAKRLNISSFSPIVHPVDVEQHRQNFGKDIERLRCEIGGDVILFCPLRHDWIVKGTDVHLRALPLIKERIRRSVKLVLVRWGSQIADSERLLAELECDASVVWRGSMCRVTMIKYIRAADVVLDQMALPHFGATAPQSLAAGTPVISSYVPESTRWIIPEPAPILPAFSPEDVADSVALALDPKWREDYRQRAQEWIDIYHHPNNVIRAHLDAYQRILSNV